MKSVAWSDPTMSSPYLEKIRLKRVKVSRPWPFQAVGEVRDSSFLWASKAVEHNLGIRWILVFNWRKFTAPDRYQTGHLLVRSPMLKLHDYPLLIHYPTYNTCTFLKTALFWFIKAPSLCQFLQVAFESDVLKKHATVVCRLT